MPTQDLRGLSRSFPMDSAFILEGSSSPCKAKPQSIEGSEPLQDIPPRMPRPEPQAVVPSPLSTWLTLEVSYSLVHRKWGSLSFWKDLGSLQRTRASQNPEMAFQLPLALPGFFQLSR